MVISMSRKKPTINDIAKMAGVSKTTVSFAFNNPKRVAADTLDRIMNICRELNYSPDPVARTLTTKRSDTIGFLLPEITPEGFKNPLLFQILQGMRIGCLTENLSLNIISPPPGHLLETIRKTAVDGYVILGMIHDMEFFDYLHERNIPAVSLDGGVIKDIPMITTNEETGAYAIMDYVLSHNHKKILILAFKDAEDHRYPFSSSVGYRRLQGYEKALIERGMSLKSENVQTFNCIECSLEGGYIAMKEIMNGPNKPTAVVAMSDIIAMGVYQFCQENEISIPEELSVTGFDGLYEVSLLNPPLTTVLQPAVLKGEKSIAILTDYLNGKDVHSEELKVNLIEGRSVFNRP
jgi:alanine racemase